MVVCVLPVDGVDIGPALKAGKVLKRKTVLINVNKTEGAIRSGDWKLLVGFKKSKKRPKGTELFNVVSDPGESTPITNKPRIVERLLKKLKQYKSEAAEAL